MKKYLIVFIVTGITLLAGFALYASLLDAAPNPDINTTTINEITKQAGFCWHDLELLEEKSFRYRFFIVDNHGAMVYSSDEDLPDTLQ